MQAVQCLPGAILRQQVEAAGQADGGKCQGEAVALFAQIDIGRAGCQPCRQGVHVGQRAVAAYGLAVVPGKHALRLVIGDQGQGDREHGSGQYAAYIQMQQRVQVFAPGHGVVVTHVPAAKQPFGHEQDAGQQVVDEIGEQ